MSPRKRELEKNVTKKVYITTINKQEKELRKIYKITTNRKDKLKVVMSKNSTTFSSELDLFLISIYPYTEYTVRQNSFNL